MTGSGKSVAVKSKSMLVACTGETGLSNNEIHYELSQQSIGGIQFALQVRSSWCRRATEPLRWKNCKNVMEVVDSPEKSQELGSGS